MANALSSDWMLSLLALARELEIPELLMEPLIAAAEALPGNLPIEALSHPETAESAWEQISDILPEFEQDRGMAQLAVTLAAAVLTRDGYRQIPDSVFLATMKCLPRFLLETHDMFGFWGYNRGFWTWRQVGGLLFRLGTLEFEYCILGEEGPMPEGMEPGDAFISVHIPSDAILSRQELDRSYGLARDFFSGTVPGPWLSKPPKAFLCESWLLSPSLNTLLKPGSGIARFYGDYEIYAVHPDSPDFYEWLFKLPEPVPAEVLAETTSLQRAVKNHLLSGGFIGAASGVLSL